MWKLYLQYYLWRLLPKFFEQPCVPHVKKKIVRAERISSFHYNLTFDKMEDGDHFVNHLKQFGYSVLCAPLRQIEDLDGRLRMAQAINTDRQLDAQTLMPYFEFHPGRIELSVGPHDVVDSMITREVVTVPWQPGMKG